MNSPWLFRNKLPREFYLRGTLTVARELLGKYLVRRLNNEQILGMIVEVEGYLGERDPASHAYRGRTRRNEVMFWAGGYLYVYFTYGMHFCSNVVTGAEGKGHAVLIRALEPRRGVGIMRRNRRMKNEEQTQLLSGPAKICQALQIGRGENGTDLCGGEIWIAENPDERVPRRIARSTRVGVSKGREHRWRFFLPGNPYVSPGRPA
jgi:DNA-3-methyladenine glycosylase